MKRKILSFILVLFILISLASCSSSSNYDSGNNSSKYESNDLVEETDRKVIYSVSYNFSGEKDKAITDIKLKVRSIGGYIESSRSSEESASYTYKIPTVELNSFLDYVDSIDGIGNKVTSTKDVTSSYDSFSKKIDRLNAEKTIYENEIANNPSLTVEQKLDYNYRISEIENEIANAYSYYDKLKNELDYSTVSIYYEDGGASNWFKKFGLIMLSCLAFIAYAACIVAPFALIGFIVYIILRKKKKVNE